MIGGARGPLYGSNLHFLEEGKENIKDPFHPPHEAVSGLGFISPFHDFNCDLGQISQILAA